MTQVEYIQIRLCSCIYLYLFCLRTVFVPFVIRAFRMQARKIIFIKRESKLLPFKTIITMRLKSKTSKLNSSKEFGSIASICNTISSWGLITKCLYNIFLNSRARLSKVTYRGVSDSIVVICNTLSSWGLIPNCLYNILLDSCTILLRVNLQQSF